MQSIGFTIAGVVTAALANVTAFAPQFFGGLIILLAGLIIAAILKEIVLRFFSIVKVEQWFDSFGTWLNSYRTERQTRTSVWVNILAELVRWTIVILFLVPAVEAWGLPRATDVLNQLLLYLPNVFVAVVVGFIGLVIANLVFSVVHNATSEMGSDSSNLLASVARYAMVFFTALVVLNQLGVAADLIRILFTGIVAMLALAGGIAFGLGGRDAATRSLDNFGQRVITPQVPEITASVVRTVSKPRLNNRKVNRRKTR